MPSFNGNISEFMRNLAYDMYRQTGFRGATEKVVAEMKLGMCEEHVEMYYAHKRVLLAERECRLDCWRDLNGYKHPNEHRAR